MMKERKKEQERIEAESKTQVGAVKRLIQRVSSLSVGGEPIVKKRSKTSRNLGIRRSLSQTGVYEALDDYQANSENDNNSHSMKKLR